MTESPARFPDWPRLMGERMAADYLSIGTTMLRAKGPKPKKIGGRTLWDRRDLDRFADSLGQPDSFQDEEALRADVERRWFEKRAGRKPKCSSANAPGKLVTA